MPFSPAVVLTGLHPHCVRDTPRPLALLPWAPKLSATGLCAATRAGGRVVAVERGVVALLGLLLLQGGMAGERAMLLPLLLLLLLLPPPRTTTPMEKPAPQ